MKLVAKSYEVKEFIEDAVAQIIDSRKHKGYLAKIVGTHPTYKLERKFVDTYKVSGYKYADIKEDGLYEFCTSKSNKVRYYLLVDNDVITEIDYRQALEIVENRKENIMKLVAKSYEVKEFIEDAVAQIIDSRKHKGYLAKIVGTHPTYKLERKFVDTYKVSGYKYADIKEDGLYEFCTSKSNKVRYYLLVDNDVITEIDYRQALEIVENMEEK